MGLPGNGVDVILTLVVFVTLALAILGTAWLGTFLTDLGRKLMRAKKRKTKKVRPCGRECDC